MKKRPPGLASCSPGVTMNCLLYVFPDAIYTRFTRDLHSTYAALRARTSANHTAWRLLRDAVFRPDCRMYR
jgi:hypothetical protein